MSFVINKGSSAAQAAGAEAVTSIARTPISPMLISELMRLYDLAVIGISGVAIHQIYVEPSASDVDSRYFGSIAVATIIAGFVGQWLRTYSVDVVFEHWLGLRRALAAWLVAFAICLSVVFALKITSSYSRVWAVSWFVLAGALLVAGHYLFQAMTRRWALQGRLANRSIVVGVGEQARRLAAFLRSRGDPRTHILGFVDEHGTVEGFVGSVDARLIGGVESMMALIRGSLVDEVIIALPWSEEQRIQQLMLRLATTPVRVCLAPDLIGFRFADRAFTNRAGLPLLKVLDRPITGWSFLFKWIEDKVVAVIALVLLAPLMLIISAATKLDSPGPVLFRQRRFGFNDQLIEVWKFRTMRVEFADADGRQQATKGDPRVTRVGRFLRRTSLDELPQLFNVLYGDMSIVGPRPHPVETKAAGKLFQEVVDRYAARHRVKPGITGWAQVNGWRGETDTIEKIRRRVEFDLYYIDNWSVWFDLYILLKTVIAVLPSDNSY